MYQLHLADKANVILRKAAACFSDLLIFPRVEGQMRGLMKKTFLFTWA